MKKKLSKSLSLSNPSERLKHLRALLRVSRAFLQEKHGIPEVTLKSWENGTVKLSLAGVKRCIDAYRDEGLIVTEDWLLEGIGLDPTSSATIGQYFAEPKQAQMPLKDDEACMIRDANLFKESYANAVVMMVSGDEMRPFYKPGDYVGGKLRSGKDIKTVINKDCIVYLKDKSRFFRRVVKNSSGGINLTCLNPNENTSEPVLFNVKVESVAPIIWHRSKDD